MVPPELVPRKTALLIGLAVHSLQTHGKGCTVSGKIAAMYYDGEAILKVPDERRYLEANQDYS